MGAYRSGERGGEDQLGDLGGGVTAEFAVDLLGASIAMVGDVVDHRGKERGVDALDLVAHLGIVQIQVLGADQEAVVGLAVPDTGGPMGSRGQADKGATASRAGGQTGSFPGAPLTPSGYCVRV